MENRKKTFRELSGDVLAQMKRLGYSAEAIAKRTRAYNKIAGYAEANFDSQIFSEELGALYLKRVFDYPGCETTPKVRYHVTCIKKLGEYHLYGAFIRAIKINDESVWSAKDAGIIKSYIESTLKTDTSQATKRTKTYHVKLFYKFLGLRSISGIDDVTPEIISDYVKYLQGYSPVYVKHRLATLRYYFRFLYTNGHYNRDLSFYIPRMKTPVNKNVPALWSRQDIEKLLSSVDRGNPTGKRNYAALCLIVTP